ncbi:MAG: hydroxymethylglutaryl-CoA reductase, degradative [Myxococcales bacterium]|nr:hydroxymethylglutaryl-CoA reductase, degradative [Myxococcales bacterium]
MSSSRLPGFFRLPPADRAVAALAGAGLGPELASRWTAAAGLSLPAADAMIENVVGLFTLPNAIAVNLLLNGADRLVPMVVEEPSVVAAVSNMARLTRLAGGVVARCDDAVMIGQVQLVDCPDGAAERVRNALPRLGELAAAVHPQLAEYGGGLRGMDVRELVYDEPGEAPEAMVVLHFHLDCVDAMGANMVNTVAERLAPVLAELTGGRVGLRILSNLADQRIATATLRLPVALLTDGDTDGAEVAAGIASAWRFAWADPYRAATHNKGIMNGVDAVAIATGNDWRAIEAGAHAYAARDGQYRPLSSWKVRDGCLVGELTLPMQVGTVSGAIRVHPTVQANLAVASVTGARDLSMLIAAVGLIQNLGALRALATHGIQHGHMRMHARSLAMAAGAGPDELNGVVMELVRAREFTVERARAALSAMRA